jgi:hypothetical protein
MKEETDAAEKTGGGEGGGNGAVEGSAVEA